MIGDLRAEIKRLRQKLPTTPRMYGNSTIKIRVRIRELEAQLEEQKRMWHEARRDPHRGKSMACKKHGFDGPMRYG